MTEDEAKAVPEGYSIAVKNWGCKVRPYAATVYYLGRWLKYTGCTRTPEAAPPRRPARDRQAHQDPHRFSDTP